MMNDVQEMVQVTMKKETFEFLTALATEMKNQDHHCTRMPYVVQIAQEVEKADERNPDYYKWFNEEYDEIGETYKEFLEQAEHCEISEEEFKEFLEENDVEIKEDGSLDFSYSWGLDEIADELKLERIGCSLEMELKNYFFTQKAAKEHLEAKAHHYTGKNPRTYVNHALYNSELEGVVRAIEEITQIDCFHT